MDAIILAAGYATRLYPLTKDKPKPLLEVAGKPMVEHIIGKIEKIGEINKIYIVTNSKFKPYFDSWFGNFVSGKAIEIVDDGTSSNEDRLGAFGDIHFVIHQKKLNDDFMVIAGDNLFEMNLKDAYNFFKKRKSNVIVLYDVKDKVLARQYGIVEIKNFFVVDFVEKPASPKSTLASTGIYLFPKKTMELVNKYIEQGNNPDKTGSFVEWLYKREKVFAYVTERMWYDIGTIEQLEKAGRHYKGE